MPTAPKPKKQAPPLVPEGEEIPVVNATNGESHPDKSLLTSARRVLLASIGVVALAQEEIEDFVNKLIEKGEIAEKDGQKLVKDILERRTQRAERAEEKLEDRVSSMLNRMNIPTKSDIEALSSRIADLNKKIDDLQQNSKN
ncbi:MAG: phasin family protein [Chloroflexi bacterium]|nr:phasin family protein [Chloroflexota bacterium]